MDIFISGGILAGNPRTQQKNLKLKKKKKINNPGFTKIGEILSNVLAVVI